MNERLAGVCVCAGRVQPNLGHPLRLSVPAVVRRPGQVHQKLGAAGLVAGQPGKQHCCCAMRPGSLPRLDAVTRFFRSLSRRRSSWNSRAARSRASATRASRRRSPTRRPSRPTCGRLSSRPHRTARPTASTRPSSSPDRPTTPTKTTSALRSCRFVR